MTQLYSYILSKKGGREQNQDYCRKTKKEPLYQYILADGLGGQGGGQIASMKATKTMLLDYSKSMKSEVNPKENFSTEWLAAKFELVHDHLKQEQLRNIELSHMATTMVVLLIMDGKAIWGHVGDSRLYLFRNGEIYHQTKDHSVPQMLVSSGEIMPDEMRQHPDRNRLLRAIGDNREQIQARIQPEEKLIFGDVFLLCSDGFWEYVTESNMLESLKNVKSPKEWLHMMEKIHLLPNIEKEQRAENKEKAENDNYTALAIWYGEIPSEPVAKRNDKQIKERKINLFKSISKQFSEVVEDFLSFKRQVFREIKIEYKKQETSSPKQITDKNETPGFEALSSTTKSKKESNN